MPFCDSAAWFLGPKTNDVLPVQRACTKPSCRADCDLGLDGPAGIRANQIALECAHRQLLSRWRRELRQLRPFAARLQGVVKPSTVVLAESTRKPLGTLFEFEDPRKAGPQGYPGIGARLGGTPTSFGGESLWGPAARWPSASAAGCLNSVRPPRRRTAMARSLDPHLSADAIIETG